MNNYIIKISELALQTLDYNLLFLRDFNINYSLKIREKIITAIDSLVIFPFSHSIYKKTDKYVYRKILVGKFYHIVYTVDKNIIIILYVADARQFQDKYFNSLK